VWARARDGIARERGQERERGGGGGRRLGRTLKGRVVFASSIVSCCWYWFDLGYPDGTCGVYSHALQ
jgi:hypothetical protein